MRQALQYAFVGAALIALSLLPSTLPTSAEQKTIRDPAEYNAYITALNTADPIQKAAAMERFVVTYPNSVVKQDALEEALAAYTRANNFVAMEKSVQRILQMDRGNVKALAILTTLERRKWMRGDEVALAEMRAHAQQGAAGLTNWRKPDGVSDAQFAKMRRDMEYLFNGALGFAALRAKNYAEARGFYIAAVMIDPQDMVNVYQLGIAELEMSPIDPKGFWHVARAARLAELEKNAADEKIISDYGKLRFKRFLGSAAGWEESWARIVVQAMKLEDISLKTASTAAATDKLRRTQSLFDKQYLSAVNYAMELIEIFDSK